MSDLPDFTLLVDAEGGGTATGTTGQQSVGTSATLIVAANLSRTGLTISNPAAATSTVYIGGPAVTTTTGYGIDPGHDVTVAARQAWYGVVATGSQTVTYEDE